MSVRAIILIFTLASRPTRSRWQRNWLDKDQIQLHHVYVDRALMKCTLRNQNRIVRLFPLNDIMSHRSWKLWTKLMQFIPCFIKVSKNVNILYYYQKQIFFYFFRVQTVCCVKSCCTALFLPLGSFPGTISFYLYVKSEFFKTLHC